MKYVDEFRNAGTARELRRRIRLSAEALLSRGKTARIMEVCGTHTMAIARYGIRDVLPPGSELISGPGCPVCVTAPGYIDAAIQLAGQSIRIMTFGDMLHVPGSGGRTLAQARARGAAVEVCYTPSLAVTRAREAPGQQVVFLAIGFETTIAPVIHLIPEAMRANVTNLSLLTAFKQVIPAMSALLADPDNQIGAFLCPAHVSAIIGADAYQPLCREHHVPCVVAGFEPLDILLALDSMLRQLAGGRSDVENQYSRVVRAGGNPKAQEMIRRHLEPAPATWRGLGELPASGYAIRPAFSRFDAAARFGVAVGPGRSEPGCRCGEVIKGRLRPPECPLFGKACVPEYPVGPCMVSSEGTCAAYFKYSR